MPGGRVAEEQERESTDGEDELRRDLREERADPDAPETFRLRARALAEATWPSVRRAPIYDETDALEDLWAFATELQGLYDLRSTAMLNSDARSEIEDRSKRLINTARIILGFINGGADAPLAAPILTPTGSFQARVEQLMILFRQLIDPTVRVIAGDVLDVQMLHQVRSGFATMEALILTIPESSSAATVP
jgi:hypothetical protein